MPYEPRELPDPLLHRVLWRNPKIIYCDDCWFCDGDHNVVSAHVLKWHPLQYEALRSRMNDEYWKEKVLTVPSGIVYCAFCLSKMNMRETLFPTLLCEIAPERRCKVCGTMMEEEEMLKVVQGSEDLAQFVATHDKFWQKVRPDKDAWWKNFNELEKKGLLDRKRYNKVYQSLKPRAENTEHERAGEWRTGCRPRGRREKKRKTTGTVSYRSIQSLLVSRDSRLAAKPSLRCEPRPSRTRRTDPSPLSDRSSSRYSLRS